MMNKLFFSALVLFLFQNISWLQGTTEPKFRWLTAGIPPSDEYITARDSVTKKWGIDYVTVAGCIVSESLMDSINTHNDSVGKLLRMRFGDDWNDRFQSDVNSFISNQKRKKDETFRDAILYKTINDNWSVIRNESGNIFRFSKIESSESAVNTLDTNSIIFNGVNFPHAYRGYDNRFELKTNDLPTSFELEFLDEQISLILDSSKQTNHIIFTLRISGTGRSSLFKVKNSTDTLSRIIHIRNLPLAQVYINGSDSVLSKKDVSRGLIFEIMCVDKETGFEIKFGDIESWEMLTPNCGNIVTSDSGLSKEAKKCLKKCKKGGYVSFVFLVRINDRKIKKASLFKVVN